MTVENVTYISDLEPANPKGGDSIAQGDNHIRNTKLALRNTFPNIDGEVLVTDEELNLIQGLDRPITEIIQDGTDADNDLDARVTKNEQDIAQNTSDIAQNASDIAQNASDIAQNASDIAQNASDIAANSSALAGKADKSYVDSENAAQDAVIASKADKSYVDSQNSAQDAVIAQKADKSYVDSQDNALSGRIDSLENADHSHDLDSHTDVDVSGVQEGDALVWDGSKWIAKKAGGAMLTLVEQPLNVGSFQLKPSIWSDLGYGDPAYQVATNEGYNSSTVHTFNVPAGKVFALNYIYCHGFLDIPLNSIRVDGVSVCAASSDVIQFTDAGSADFVFKAWPSSLGAAVIKVEQSLQFTTIGRGGSSGLPATYISGVFVEA